ncbi:MAG TPA: hypothetical protein VFV05_02185 [Methylomirabilota bacterium]|nr:hypothetical protein [Methylomirabilota bacterium]
MPNTQSPSTEEERARLEQFLEWRRRERGTGPHRYAWAAAIVSLGVAALALIVVLREGPPERAASSGAPAADVSYPEPLPRVGRAAPADSDAAGEAHALAERPPAPRRAAVAEDRGWRPDVTRTAPPLARAGTPSSVTPAPAPVPSPQPETTPATITSTEPSPPLTAPDAAAPDTGRPPVTTAPGASPDAAPPPVAAPTDPAVPGAAPPMPPSRPTPIAPAPSAPPPIASTPPAAAPRAAPPIASTPPAATPAKRPVSIPDPIEKPLPEPLETVKRALESLSEARPAKTITRWLKLQPPPDPGPRLPAPAAPQSR